MTSGKLSAFAETLPVAHVAEASRCKLNARIAGEMSDMVAAFVARHGRKRGLAAFASAVDVTVNRAKDLLYRAAMRIEAGEYVAALTACDAIERRAASALGDASSKPNDEKWGIVLGDALGTDLGMRSVACRRADPRNNGPVNAEGGRRHACARRAVPAGGPRMHARCPTCGIAGCAGCGW